MTRSLLNSIDYVITLVPEKGNEHLITRLEKLRQSCIYSAPEIIEKRWGEFCYLLNLYIGNIKEQWAFEIEKFISSGEEPPTPTAQLNLSTISE